MACTCFFGVRICSAMLHLPQVCLAYIRCAAPHAGSNTAPCWVMRMRYGIPESMYTSLHCDRVDIPSLHLVEVANRHTMPTQTCPQITRQPVQDGRQHDLHMNQGPKQNVHAAHHLQSRLHLRNRQCRPQQLHLISNRQQQQLQCLVSQSFVMICFWAQKTCRSGNNPMHALDNKPQTCSTMMGHSSSMWPMSSGKPHSWSLLPKVGGTFHGKLQPRICKTGRLIQWN